jgi:hypothetical protein
MALTWANVREGKWATEEGDSITLVNPRGMRLYAVRLVGTRRPEWFRSLREAKAGRHDVKT